MQPSSLMFTKKWSEWPSFLSRLRTSRTRLSRIRLCTISIFMAMVLPLIGVALDVARSIIDYLIVARFDTRNIGAR